MRGVVLIIHLGVVFHWASAFLAPPSLSDVIVHDIAYVLSSSLPKTTICGPQKIHPWRVEFEALFDNTGGLTKDGYFRSGVFKAPVAGFYHICISARIKALSQGDFTVLINSNPFVLKPTGHEPVEAAFGSACTSRCKWSSHQTCFNRLLEAGDTVSVFLRSGKSTDCLEQTEWEYAKFDVFLTQPTSNVTVTP